MSTDQAAPVVVSPVEQLLRNLPSEEWDRTRPLMSEGPQLVFEITGREMHRSTLWRNATEGIAGERLRCAEIVGVLYTTPRWLAEFWLGVASARRSKR